MGDYIESMKIVLLTPWRVDGGALERGSGRRLVAVVVAHIVLAACISTVPSSWTYLVGKGIVLGASSMDLGSDDLPPDTVGQVAGGLIGSVFIWSAVLGLAVGVCILVADWLNLRTAEGFGAAVRRCGTASVWFVVWAMATFVASLERGGRLAHPARWPAGESWEVSDRLIYLVILFPVVWGLGLRPPGQRGGPLRTAAFVGLAVLLCWIVWIGVWRALPWIAIDAYTG